MSHAWCQRILPQLPIISDDLSLSEWMSRRWDRNRSAPTRAMKTRSRTVDSCRQLHTQYASKLKSIDAAGDCTIWMMIIITYRASALQFHCVINWRWARKVRHSHCVAHIYEYMCLCVYVMMWPVPDNACIVRSWMWMNSGENEKREHDVIINKYCGAIGAR